MHSTTTSVLTSSTSELIYTVKKPVLGKPVLVRRDRFRACLLPGRLHLTYTFQPTGAWAATWRVTGEAATSKGIGLNHQATQMSTDLPQDEWPDWIIAEIATYRPPTLPEASALAVLGPLRPLLLPQTLLEVVIAGLRAAVAEYRDRSGCPDCRRTGEICPEHFADEQRAAAWAAAEHLLAATTRPETGPDQSPLPIRAAQPTPS
ncbi:hypothetical protein [Nonomuraea sp. NPDC049695]|uniref:hypothetical protein n=1 Tax=Nonomuraea sp. NPDC049695 TaxID=3154734 RepID=UPI00341472AD